MEDRLNDKYRRILEEAENRSLKDFSEKNKFRSRMDLFLCAAMMIILVGILYSVYRPAEEYAIKPPKTVIIEGHEYFAVRLYGGGFSLCHKGNCKFCNK